METLENEPRGCGTLKRSTGYLRSDIGGLGVLPPFVEFSEYIPHLEYSGFRGWKKFPGLQFELGVDIPTVEHNYDREKAYQMMVERGLYETTEAVPDREVDRHIDRLRGDVEGNHVGEMAVANAHDLLLWIGKSNYPFPQDFIEETRERGLNRAIPLSKSNDPPNINPGRTRAFVIHPRAYEAPQSHERDYYPGIIGYAYVTRVIYTRPEDDKVPQYVQEYLSKGSIDAMVDFDAPTDGDDGVDQDTTLREFEVE